MPTEPGKPGFGRDGEASQTLNAALTALSKGYVVTSPGAHGRTVANDKAPTTIANLKATARYLKFSDKATPGDAGEIVSNEASVGEALSALLGATGNSRDYETHLKALGVAEGGDGIFAMSAYCPTIDLDHVDTACEWQFNGTSDCQKTSISMLDHNVKRELIPGTLTKEEISLSNQLKPLYPAYTNSLKLKSVGDHALMLDKDGNSNFKGYVAGYPTKSTQSQLDAGRKLSNRNWFTVENGKATAADSGKYAKAAGRRKTPPVFSGVDLSTEENQLFGNAQTDGRHFIGLSMRYSTAENTVVTDTEIVKAMSPLNYIDAFEVKIPQNRCTRVGTADRDTSLAVSVVLAVRLQDNEYAVDYFLSWDVPHNGDYDLEELFVRMKQVSAQK